MAGARRREEWGRVLTLMVPLCAAANPHLKRPLRVGDFDPFRRKRSTPAGLPVTAKDLVTLFVKK